MGIKELKLMGIRNRANGNKFELKVMKQMERNCIYVCHSSGSYGIFDLVGIKKDGSIRLVNCKANGYLELYERKRIGKFMRKMPKNITIELWYYKSPKKMTRRYIRTEMDL